jgi:hypothetical protein
MVAEAAGSAHQSGLLHTWILQVRILGSPPHHPLLQQLRALPVVVRTQWQHSPHPSHAFTSRASLQKTPASTDALQPQCLSETSNHKRMCVPRMSCTGCLRWLPGSACPEAAKPATDTDSLRAQCTTAAASHSGPAGDLTAAAAGGCAEGWEAASKHALQVFVSVLTARAHVSVYVSRTSAWVHACSSETVCMWWVRRRRKGGSCSGDRV